MLCYTYNRNNPHLVSTFVKEKQGIVIMSVQGDIPRDSNFPVKETEDIRAESRMKDSLPEVEIHKSQSNVHQKMKLPNILPNVDQTLKRVPGLQLTAKRNLPGVPVDEIGKVRQKTRRVLPCLPPVVEEILRWSIHPQEVLRGAASVSHLLMLQTIEEENLSTVQGNDTTARPGVPRALPMLPKIPLTENRALPSMQPNETFKALSRLREEFRKRMQPSLPTIKELVSTTLPEVRFPNGQESEGKPLQDPEVQFAEKQEDSRRKEIRSIQKKRLRRDHKQVKGSQTSLPSAEKDPRAGLKLINREKLSLSAQKNLSRSPSGRKNVVECRRAESEDTKLKKVSQNQRRFHLEAKDLSQILGLAAQRQPPKTPIEKKAEYSRENEGQPSVYPKVNRTHPSLLSMDSFVWSQQEDMPRLRARLARQSKKLFLPTANREVNSCSGNPKPVLPIIQKTQNTVMLKPLSPEPKISRVCPTATRPLPSIPTAQKPITPKPSSTPKMARVCTTVNRPLPSILPAKEPLTPIPPSTPKKSSGAHPNVLRARVAKLRPLTSIEQVAGQISSSVNASMQQNRAKFPLSSCHNVSDVQPNNEMGLNLEPLVKKRAKGIINKEEIR